MILLALKRWSPETPALRALLAVVISVPVPESMKPVALYLPAVVSDTILEHAFGHAYAHMSKSKTAREHGAAQRTRPRAVQNTAFSRLHPFLSHILNDAVE